MRGEWVACRVEGKVTELQPAVRPSLLARLRRRITQVDTTKSWASAGRPSNASTKK